MKYDKIKKEDVLNVLISCATDVTSPISNITLVNIASVLNTSRYQVKKYMDCLVKMGLAEYSVQVYADEYGTIPVCGYHLTDTVKAKDPLPDSLNKTGILGARAMYQREKARVEKALAEVGDFLNE